MLVTWLSCLYMDTTHYCLACSVEMRHPNAVYGQRWHQTWLGEHQCNLFCQRLCMHCLPSSMWQCSLALLVCPNLLLQLTQCCTCAAAELQSCSLSNFFLPGALSVIFRWEASTQRAQILKNAAYTSMFDVIITMADQCKNNAVQGGSATAIDRCNS